jgi:hypothetical protein
MSAFQSWELPMAVRHLKAANTKRFKAMKKRERILAIRELASGSTQDKAFVHRTFPARYREAFLAR